MSKNSISKVAIVGAAGRVGEFITSSLVATGKHTVTAISRADGTSTFPEGVKVAKVDYDNVQTLVDAMKGQDCLIITMSVMAPQDTSAKLIEAAAKASVPYILPNEWGIDSSNIQLGQDVVIGQAMVQNRQLIESLGKSSWIAMVCSFWYEYSLGSGQHTYGFDWKKREVTFFDKGETKINTSTWPQCGRAVAALLSLPLKSEGGKPGLEDFKNRFVYFSSFTVSQKDMFESVKRVTGTADKDWDIKYEDTKGRYEKGVERMKGGERIGFARMLYARLFFPDGAGNFEKTQGLSNELLALPKEDLDEATKGALEYNNTAGSLGD